MTDSRFLRHGGPFVWLVLCLLMAGEALAHGGQYGNPGGNGGTPGPKPGSPRSGGVTPGTDPSWLNWWDRNREDYFDVRARRMEKSETGENAQGRYEPNGAHVAATRKDVRETIVPLLLAAAKDKSADVRDAAAIALGRAGEIPVMETLVGLLTDNDRRVRQAAILGLGLLKHPMARQRLVGVMHAQDTKFKERGIAALALGLSGDAGADPVLLENLGAARPFSRLSSIKAREVDGCRALALGLSGRSEHVNALLTALKKDRTKDRSFPSMALVALGKLGDPLATPAAIGLLKARDNDTRRGAAIMVGRTVKAEDAKTVKKLLKLWKAEKDAHARYFLTISLGRIGGDEILGALRKTAARHKNREDRAFASVALGVARDFGSADALIKMLRKERDVSLRAAAATSLAILDHRPAAKTMFATLQDTKNPDLRAALIVGLAMLDHREALPEIRQILAIARNERLVRACGFAMAVMYEQDSLAQMISTMKNSGSIQVKGGMAAAIGRTGDRRVIEPLVKLVKTRSETDLTRAFAVVALGLIGDKSPRSDFTRIAIDSNYAMVNAEAFREVIDIF